MSIKTLLNNTELFSKHIKLLYSAANESDGWGKFIDALVSDLNCQSSLFSIEKTNTAPIPFIKYKGFVQEDIDFYFKNIIDNDIWLNSRMLFENQTEFFTSDSKVSYKSFRNSFFYKEFCESRDIHFASGGYITGTSNSKGLLTLQRNFQQGSFYGDEITYLNLLYPHIENALKLYERLDILEQEEKKSSVLFNKLPWPVFIINANIEILDVNFLADTLLQQRDDFRKKGKKLIFSPYPLKLDSYIDKISKQLVSFSRPEPTLTLKGKSTCYEIFCVPFNLEYHNKINLPKEHQFILFINIHNSTYFDFTQKVKSLYGLTNAEALVMNGVVNGVALEDIANQNGLKYSTVKSYLRTTFQKTDTNRQHELVSKFMKNYITDLYLK